MTSDSPQDRIADQNAAGSGLPRPVWPMICLSVLAILYTLYFAASLLIPCAIAILLALQLFPLVNFLSRFYIPRALSAAMLIVAIGVPFTLLGMELVEPAKKWMERVPQLTATLNEKVEDITEALSPKTGNTVAEEAPGETEEPGAIARFMAWFSDDSEEPVAPEPAPDEKRTAIADQLVTSGLDMSLTLLAQAPLFLAQCVLCIILVIFLLVYGPGIYSTAISEFPKLRRTLTASHLVADTQRELSRYILTVSLINTALGMCTALALWLMGFEDPLLWGAMVALLNFAPYVGPVCSAGILCIAGWAQYDISWEALYPALVYFLINAVEANIITPAVLGRRMRMNPLVIIIWLMVWGWLWGIAGVLIAVPLLVCIKLVLSRSDGFEHWIQLIESRG